MTDKQIIIDVSDCSELCGTKCHILMSCTNTTKSDSCSEMPNCYYKQLKRKEQECEELQQYHNKCCEEFEKEKKEWLEKYNQVSRDFYNGKYCNKENCSLLKAKEQECKRLEEELYYWVNGEYCDNKCNVVKELDQLNAELTKANCQIADDEILQCDMREAIEELKAENDNAKETFDGLLKIQYKLADNCKKLRQCLTEIEELARVNSINTCWSAINLCADCNEIEECGLQSPFEKLKAIIQKINECEGNND